MNFDPRPPVPPQRLAWIALTACFAANVLGSVVIRLNLPVGLWFNEVFCILGVTWALTRWSGRAPAAYVKLSWPGLSAVLFAAGLSVANYVGLAGPITALSEHFAPEWLKDSLDINHLLDGLAPGELWLFSGGAVLAAAFCEEFLFRGVVQRGLSATKAFRGESVLLAALVFALFHLAPVRFLGLLELGLFFGILYERTGSLVPGMAAHAAQNATAVGIYYFFERRLGDVPEGSGELALSKVAGLAGMGIVVLAMLVLLGRHFPAVWGHPKAAAAERPRTPLARALAPWLVSASLFLLGWYAVDRRGVELGVADWQVELSAAHDDESADVRSARAELEALRRNVRVGKSPLHQYLESRRALAESLGKHPPKAPSAKER